MPAKDKPVPPLLLDLLRAIHEGGHERPTPRWVSISSLDFDHAPERIGAAITLAVLNGWASLGSGNNIIITNEGLKMIEKGSRLPRVPGAE